MSNTKTVMGQASNQYVAPLDITDVFSTYLYDGTGSAQTITNGIDLAGEGGLVWIKDRSTTEQHVLTNTERGATKFVKSNSNGDEQTNAQALTSFNSNGFSIGNYADVNQNTDDFASWTFRKAPKFFDVVTYTGDGVAGREISHSLGSAPGSIFVKRTNDTGHWYVYHRSTGSTGHLVLNLTDSFTTFSGGWNDTNPTDTEFTLGNSGYVNASGDTYVAYLFAHNNGDGGFGPDNSDIIKCGSYTGNGSTNGPEIDLGFEPQWLLIKNTGTTSQWRMMDNMRGLPVGGTDISLEANESNSETTDTNTANIDIKPNGFKITTTRGDWNNNGNTIIYIAIRRGPLAAPTAGTEVFKATDMSSSALAATGFSVDLTIDSSRTSTSSRFVNDRLRGSGVFLATDSTAAESTGGSRHFDSNDGVIYTSAFTGINWSWKRAPGYFDVVAFTSQASGSTKSFSHNLTVAPEMIWLKNRPNSDPWLVYHSALGLNKYLVLNTTAAEATEASWISTPSATEVTGIKDNLTYNNSTYIAYLFSTLAGISKVGSYTGNGSSQTIDCGFTSGARFVLIKKTSAVGYWSLFDTARGIVAGNDKLLRLDTTDAELTAWDSIDPHDSGFTVQTSSADLNDNGVSYIFYAIA